MSVVGRKKASFTKEQLQEAIERKYTLRELCFYLSAGDATIRKRMREWNIKRTPLRIARLS